LLLELLLHALSATIVRRITLDVFFINMKCPEARAISRAVRRLISASSGAMVFLLTSEPTDFRQFWTLEPSIHYLNHGSYGACPRPVLEAQGAIQNDLEHEPVRFFTYDLPSRGEAARRALAAFVGASPEDVVFVRNATTGVNTVLRSLSFSRGDE